MERLCSLKRRLEVASVTDVADGDRWIHRPIMCTPRILKNYFHKGCAHISFVKNPSVASFLLLPSSFKERLPGWSVRKDGRPPSLARAPGTRCRLCWEVVRIVLFFCSLLVTVFCASVSVRYSKKHPVAWRTESKVTWYLVLSPYWLFNIGGFFCGGFFCCCGELDLRFFSLSLPNRTFYLSETLLFPHHCELFF